MKLFIPLVGQYTNIGDTLHRSVLIEWLQAENELHLYVGNAPPDFISGLYLPENVILYKNIASWLCAAIASSSNACFVYNSGEITGTKRRFVKEILLWPTLLCFRIFGRPILKVGVDIQQRGALESHLYKLSNALTTYSYYRTNESYARYGNGEVIPDLGFYRYTENSQRKKYIAISFRFDKYVSSNAFLEALVNFARNNSLTIIVVTQVRMDNASGEDLSARLESLGHKPLSCYWPHTDSHATQESRLNEIYQQSLITISDRLHVLVAAANNGSMPLCLAPYDSHKVRSHFNVIQYTDLVFNYNNMSSNEIYEILHQTPSRECELQEKLVRAKQKLENIRHRLNARITQSD